MAAELSAGLPPEDLRQLFFRIGQRLAHAMPIPRCDTLGDLEAEFNARWDDIDWGFTSLSEDADCVFITHACSPIAVAFGPDATNWSVGFFEGIYQAWFDAQQMPSSLRVLALPPDAQGGPRIDLRLAKEPS
ncbi:cellulose biosynthesis protein BcsD [Variovorax sp. E3]|uniref:cellulose biosynthesis protein BcsD n=1 Tax=Variovorax sp. E3 TaxID=1914993 RepID=UPI0022B7419E|nr:cellulose biosynthesis protein BcsD [Variovorax sp. E3]